MKRLLFVSLVLRTNLTAFPRIRRFFELLEDEDEEDAITLALQNSWTRFCSSALTSLSKTSTIPRLKFLTIDAFGGASCSMSSTSLEMAWKIKRAFQISNVLKEAFFSYLPSLHGHDGNDFSSILIHSEWTIFFLLSSSRVNICFFFLTTRWRWQLFKVRVRSSIPLTGLRLLFNWGSRKKEKSSQGLGNDTIPFLP